MASHYDTLKVELTATIEDDVLMLGGRTQTPTSPPPSLNALALAMLADLWQNRYSSVMQYSCAQLVAYIRQHLHDHDSLENVLQPETSAGTPAEQPLGHVVCTIDLPDISSKWMSHAQLPQHSQYLSSEPELRAKAALSKQASVPSITLFLGPIISETLEFLPTSSTQPVSANNKIALATASTGIAATLLKGGQTAHSRFGIPIEPDGPDYAPHVTEQSIQAAVIREAALVIWDEAVMAHKDNINCVDRSFVRNTRSGEPEAYEPRYCGLP